MSTRYDVTKNFRGVLPKVKGHVWKIFYYPVETRSIGNVSIYLWSKKFGLTHDIMGSSYVFIRESHTPEEVQGIILRGANRAMYEAENKVKKISKGIPSNILNQSSSSVEV